MTLYERIPKTVITVYYANLINFAIILEIVADCCNNNYCCCRETII